MEIIRQWFKAGQPYQEGVQLYLQYGADAVLKRCLASEEKTAFKVGKLHEALKMLLQHSPLPSESLTSHLVTPQEISAGKAHDPVLKPKPFEHWPPHPIEDIVLKALWNGWKPLFGEMKSLQQRLYQVALGGLTDPNKRLEAGQMAHRILELDDQVEAIYESRDYYYRLGKLPAAVETSSEEIVDPVRWATELKNNERYVREYKLKLKKSPDGKNSAKWAAKLLEKQALVTKYKKLLKIDE